MTNNISRDYLSNNRGCEICHVSFEFEKRKGKISKQPIAACDIHSVCMACFSKSKDACHICQKSFSVSRIDKDSPQVDENLMKILENALSSWDPFQAQRKKVQRLTDHEIMMEDTLSKLDSLMIKENNVIDSRVEGKLISHNLYMIADVMKWDLNALNQELQQNINNWFCLYDNQMKSVLGIACIQSTESLADWKIHWAGIFTNNLDLYHSLYQKAFAHIVQQNKNHRGYSEIKEISLESTFTVKINDNPTVNDEKWYLGLIDLLDRTQTHYVKEEVLRPWGVQKKLKAVNFEPNIENRREREKEGDGERYVLKQLKNKSIYNEQS